MLQREVAEAISKRQEKKLIYLLCLAGDASELENAFARSSNLSLLEEFDKLHSPLNQWSLLLRRIIISNKAETTVQ